MRKSTLLGRRMRARYPLFTGLALLGLVLGAVAAGLSGYVMAAPDAGIRTTIASSGTPQAAVELTSRRVDDADAATAGVRSRLDQRFPGVDYHLYRSAITPSRPVHEGPDGPPQNVPEEEEGGYEPLAQAALATYEGIDTHAELVEGRWPATGREGVLPVAAHARSAEALDLSVGDVLSVVDGDRVVRVDIVGVWAPSDAESPYWFGQELEIAGAEQRVKALLLADEQGLTKLDRASSETRWRMLPDMDSFTSEDAEVLSAGLPRLETWMAGDARTAELQIAAQDGLLDVLREAEENIAGAWAVTMVPVVLFGVVGIVALGVVSRLLAIVSTEETALLRSRGGAIWHIGGAAAAESFVSVIVPAALGGLIAWPVLRADSAVGALVAPSDVMAGAAVAAALGSLTHIVVASHSARALARSTVVERVATARRRPGIAADITLIVVAAAGAALWQLNRYQAPAVTGVDGVTRADPIAVAAPTLALLAGGVVAASLVGLLAWAGQRLAGRATGLSGPLAVRAVARRSSAYTLPVVLVVLATGGSTLAAGYLATWSGLQQDAATQRVGADFQVAAATAGSVTTTAETIDLGAYRAVPGVDRAVPVAVAARASASDGTASLLARPTPTGEPIPGIELPADAAALEVDLEAGMAATYVDELHDEMPWLRAESAGPPAGVVGLTLWLADPDGLIAVRSGSVDLVANAPRDVHSITMDLPGGNGPWRVVAADLSAAGVPNWDLVAWQLEYGDLAVTAMRTDSGDEVDLAPATDWPMAQLGETTGQYVAELAPLPGGVGVRVENPFGTFWQGTARSRIAAVPAQAYPEPVPGIVTEAVLTRLGLAVGDEVAFEAFGATVPVEIIESVSAIPGTATAEVVAVDLNEMMTMLLASGQSVPRINQLRIDAEPGAEPDVLAGIQELGTGRDDVLDRTVIEADLRDNAFAGMSRTVFRVASGASILVAIAGSIAATGVLGWLRRHDVAVLRLVGLSPEQQGRFARREQALVVLVAAALGVGIGWAVFMMVGGLLAAAATPDLVETLTPALRTDPLAWAGLVGVMVVAGLAIASEHGRRVRAAARDPYPRGGG